MLMDQTTGSAACVADQFPDNMVDDDAMVKYEHYVLKRSGARPVCFDGALLTQATSWCEEDASWYEGAIYEADDGSFVASLTVFFKATEHPDRHHVWQCEGPEDAVAHFRNHDPDLDIPVFLDVTPEKNDLDSLEAHAELLNTWLETGRKTYRQMLKNLLPEEGQGHP